MKSVERVLTQVPANDHVLIEAGTPLIKQFGLNVISEIRKIRPDSFIIADLKTLDTGNLEARMAANASADAVVVSGLAPVSTIEKFILEAKKTGIYSVIDMLNVEDPVALVKELASRGAAPPVLSSCTAQSMKKAVNTTGATSAQSRKLPVETSSLQPQAASGSMW